ncbi:MAG: hypothetical protein ACP5Q4_07965 [Candidatus Caldatribacteriaceae bacterium]
MANELMSKIRAVCPENLYEVGVASLAGLLGEVWDEYPYGISLARSLDDGIIDGIRNGPTIEYYNLYNAVNHELNRKSEEIAFLCRE